MSKYVSSNPMEQSKNGDYSWSSWSCLLIFPIIFVLLYEFYKICKKEYREVEDAKGKEYLESLQKDARSEIEEMAYRYLYYSCTSRSLEDYKRLYNIIISSNKIKSIREEKGRKEAIIKIIGAYDKASMERGSECPESFKKVMFIIVFAGVLLAMVMSTL